MERKAQCKGVTGDDSKGGHDIVKGITGNDMKGIIVKGITGDAI